LEQAVFARYGVMHRNTFIDAPRALDFSLALNEAARIRCAGQITGTEGYVEAMGSGLFAALNTFAELKGLEPVILPPETLLGSLLGYATDPTVTGYQPMHVNYGIIRPLDERRRRKRERYEAYSQRSTEAIRGFRENNRALLFPENYEVPFLIP
jgi:methylenetetrahydrofolate--tRNA-(uracil-5-)-methyltransferase